MLELYYKKKDKGGLEIEKKDQWHSRESLDLFPGYYFFNCML
jgi:hypothetical protein